MLPTTEYSTTIEKQTPLDEKTGYEAILRSLNAEYKLIDTYWQVGEMKKTQGWILHLSVVLYQIGDMLKEVIPFLEKQKAPYKIIMNESIAEDLLNGNFGLAQIGKIVSIYPENDSIALNLASKLIELTQKYKGPFIPTDFCLGNIVYTRYGSFNPIMKLNANGSVEKYIYDIEGNLMKDPYAMPFQFPKRVIWPFEELTKPVLPPPPQLLNRIYKPLELLKSDPKGNVFRGLYVKGFFRVKQCVIKQGFRNMNSDKAGRDIGDRLTWQNELYKRLSDIVPLPVIYDLFEEQGYMVLVMELIKGDSLYTILFQRNPFSSTWSDLPFNYVQSLLKYCIEIAQIVDRMHKRGYVHRDMAPVNFLIDKKDRIKLIDIELAYSLVENKPDPPFTLGTFGFMSPEQEAIWRPTIQEDIYGLGATLVLLFTGILPIKFNSKDTNSFRITLNFIIGNKQIANILATALHPDAKLRPPVRGIIEVLQKYQTELQANRKLTKANTISDKEVITNLLEIMPLALVGLTKPPLVIQNDVWYSKNLTIENYTALQNKQYAINPGLTEGISGILYVLARVRSVGISIDACREQSSKCWVLLKQKYFNRLPEISGGLYNGTAGFALNIAENIRCGLLEDNEHNREIIENCLQSPNEGLDLANGMAGLGLSVLKCRNYLKDSFYTSLSSKIANDLLSRQQKDGLWLDIRNIKKAKTFKTLDIGYDNSGIIYFLLEYLALHPNPLVQNAINRCLKAILNNKGYIKYIHDLVASRESYELGDGGKGLIATLINAYEIIKEEVYKKTAIKFLSKYPSRIIHPNFTQEKGLAAIGELYLEAWRVFKEEEWIHRSDWIAALYIHTFFRTEEKTGHWVMEQNSPSTAAFLSGNSGIIHFLARRLNMDKIAYRLLK